MTRLDSTPWAEIADKASAGAIVLVPVGATEQHGPHLPVTTDADIAEAVAGSVAEVDPMVVVAPVLAYGSSGEHAGFPGTLSLGQDATESLLVELGRSACADFDGVLFACAHGGNAEPLRRALARLSGERRQAHGWYPPWKGDLHAGRTETSLMLAIAPERVRIGVAEPGDLRPLDELLPLLRRSGVRSVSPNGVLGDPTGASAAEGRSLLRDAVADLAASVARLRQQIAAARTTATHDFHESEVRA